MLSRVSVSFQQQIATKMSRTKLVLFLSVNILQLNTAWWIGPAAVPPLGKLKGKGEGDMDKKINITAMLVGEQVCFVKGSQLDAFSS